MQMKVPDLRKLAKAGIATEGETVWLKVPKEVPPGSGRMVQKARFKGHNLLMNTLSFGHTEVQIGIPNGLISLIITGDDGDIVINVPTNDVDMITKNKDFPQVM